MESYRTEEEQVEMLRRWWQENGRSTIAAIILALGVGFGWQAWKQYQQQGRESASAAYQQVLQAMGAPGLTAAQESEAVRLAEQLKTDFPASTYARFAALQLARAAVVRGDLAQAQTQLRWVLGAAPADSDEALVARMRLARVLAAAGDSAQALEVLDAGEPGSYAAAYAMARGDILLAGGQRDAAREAYEAAVLLANEGGQGPDLAVLQQKLQALTPVAAALPAATAGDAAAGVTEAAQSVPENPGGEG